ncbi:hypothetical protein [Reyranella sp.]|uniref:hypothetical protein n=1 Tax=Reyranella sp. TaxID=1929291 RepID=UPI003D0D7075
MKFESPSRRDALLGVALSVLAPHAQAQSFPTRPVRLAVPYLPGGGPPVANVAAGYAPFHFGNMSAALPQVRAGHDRVASRRDGEDHADGRHRGEVRRSRRRRDRLDAAGVGHLIWWDEHLVYCHPSRRPFGPSG